ncbi:MAG: RNA-binding protein [Candidatus Spyradosoma sp.]
MDNKLFVGNLAWETSEDDLKQHFSRFGTVESAEVMRDKFTGRARGFGFVVMSTPEEAQVAIKNTEGVEFMGRPLKVNVARPRDENAPAPRERRSFGFGAGKFGAKRPGGFGAKRPAFGGPRREGGFGGAPRREGGFGGERPAFGGPRREGGFGGERREGGFKKRPFGAKRPGGFSRGPRTFDGTVD